jgi:hypothetical protein
VSEEEPEGCPGHPTHGTLVAWGEVATLTDGTPIHVVLTSGWITRPGPSGLEVATSGIVAVIVHGDPPAGLYGGEPVVFVHRHDGPNVWPSESIKEVAP